MAPSVPKKGKVHLPENEEVAAVLREKHRSMMNQLGELTEHQNRTFSTAYRNVCTAKDPIRTLDDLRRIKGVGQWVIHIMEDTFPESSLDLSSPKSNISGEKGKKRRRTKPYVPQKNSTAYAIVITLYREMISGKDVMMKQELIDAAEASGLSQFAIGANNYKAKPGSSQKDFYNGWSCMKTLLSHEVVHKWSNPAKYKLTDKGKETARDCLVRSGLDDPAGPPKTTSHSEKIILSDSDSDEPYRGNNPLIGSEHSTQRSGLPKLKALSPSSLNANKEWTTNFGEPASSCSNSPFSSRVSGQQLDSLLAMPPRRSDEKFLEAYEVVLILDDREKLGPHDKRKVAANISSQFHISVEIKHLPVGDSIWIARRRGFGTEYVLDFIVERKNVDDLIGSIRNNRYRDQKLRLKKCGLRKLIYLVEGDPNTVDASESIKTACFTTEILDGFNVQRTVGYSDTERRFGYLTRSIIDYYNTNFSIGADTSRLCLTYEEFVKRCSDIERVTLSDIFACQLMQVPQVTEEAALAVINLYPTLHSLAQAYSMLDGNMRAQEEMLKNKSSMVNVGASRNIFQLVWA